MNNSKKIVQPPFLREGDKVALVSPAYWLAEEAVRETAEVISSWGLQPVIGQYTNCQDSNAYAGTADLRAADLRWAFDDEDVKAVMCTRGGYGSIHLLNRIPLTYYAQHPKWMIGHGDITVLLSAQVASGVMAINGPMAFEMARDKDADVKVLRDLLFGTIPQYEISTNINNRPGHAEGILVGGNLSSYTSMVGTKYSMTESDLILFIEENEESLHNIDRLFYMLNLQGLLDHVQGVVLGDFSTVRHDLQVGSVEQMLTSHLHNRDIPVCCGFPVGCSSCFPLIEGAPVTLDVTAEKALLTFNIEGRKQLHRIDDIKEELIR